LVAQDLDALALAARGASDAPAIATPRASDIPASPREREVPDSPRGSERPSSPRETYMAASSLQRASSREPNAAVAFDPERVWLSANARDAFARHGIAIVRQLHNDSTFSCGFVHRIALTFALERTGARLGRRELRAVHASVDAGWPGSACVAHVRDLAAWCRRVREPLPLQSFEQRYTGRVHARSPRAWRQQGSDGGAEELLDAAVQELVMRVRGREDALVHDEGVRSARGESSRAQTWLPGLELSVLRGELSAATPRSSGREWSRALDVQNIAKV
jgi:hypothetical protein